MLNFKNRMKKHTFVVFRYCYHPCFSSLSHVQYGSTEIYSVKGEDMTIKQAIQLIEKTVNTRSL